MQAGDMRKHQFKYKKDNPYMQKKLFTSDKHLNKDAELKIFRELKGSILIELARRVKRKD